MANISMIFRPYIVCPYCGKKHSMLRKDGGLRKEIHCRCRDWTKGHTLIVWISGAGYHVFDKNANMIQAMDSYDSSMT